MKITSLRKTKCIWVAILLCLNGVALLGSSHREAPLITATPKVDGTDLYMFTSYETGRDDFVTLIANYVPLQDPGGGPNYFTLDDEAIYEIHIDNSGDAVEDITFQFQFTNTNRAISLDIGELSIAVPVINVGAITAGDNASLNVDETFTLKYISGPRRTGTVSDVSNAASGSTVFTKPADNIGNKSIPDYESYADQYIYDIDIPGCATEGRMFVGQRKDPFVVNLGETFDLVNYRNPFGAVNAAEDSLRAKNITSFILEVSKDCLMGSGGSVIAGWTTASRIEGEDFVQVSRLGQPLVNEVVIGLPDKDSFNASEPKDDGQFADYVTHPTLPAIVEILYGSAGVRAPTLFPRQDLVDVFLTGLAGLNADGGVAEVLRLNMDTPPVAASAQNNMGVIAGDSAGFPNGRRPGDDVVDIALRVVMGILLSEDDAPSGQLLFTDGAWIHATMYADEFPYLNTPLAGSPNPEPDGGGSNLRVDGDAFFVNDGTTFQGNIYNGFELGGSQATFSSIAGEITRVSYLDPDGDLVFVEFGSEDPGTTLTVNLANAQEDVASP